MSIWNRWLDRPQSFPPRRWIFQVHLWVGVVLALYVLLIGVTGASLVFRDEMEHAVTPKRVDPSVLRGGPLADPSQTAQRMRQAYPGRTLTFLAYPTPPDHLTIRGFLRKDESVLVVEAHPVTGQLLHAEVDDGFLHWLQDLHFNLLSGRTGRIVNGIGAAGLLVMATTGLIIWWPGINRWRRAIRIDTSRRWKRLNWDLHSATGFWTAALLATWGISGVYFAWPLQFGAAVNAISPVSLGKLGKPDASKKGQAPPPALSTVLADARRRTPDSKLLGVAFPIEDRGYLRVFLARETPLSYDTADYHYFDPFNGKHLGVLRRGLDESAGDTFLAWLAMLHFGTFGGHGWPGVAVKVLWVLLGLAPATLAATGLLMYWNRYLSKKAPLYWKRSAPLRSAEEFGSD